MVKTSNMVYKTLVIGVIILFISVGIQPVLAITNNSLSPITTGKTLYVGGSGEGNYSSIQDAIDNASDGDTVYVFNGTYNESINITIKSIKLFGEDKYITIINGNEKYPVIRIDTDKVHINGFTIQHSGGKGLGIVSSSNNNKFYNNIIINNYVGIFLDTECNDNKKESCNNKIYNNIIKQNLHGIIIGGDSDIGDFEIPLGKLPIKGRANIVYSNIISNNNYSGIEIYGWCNTILRNHISYNSKDSIMVDGGILLEGVLISLNNRILYNNISNNYEYGIIIQGICTLVKKNNFINNTDNAKFLSMFVRLPNRWKSNYWDDWGGTGPKIIDGFVFRFDPRGPYYGFVGIPIRNFDWFPAKKPYDIGV